MKWIEVGLFTAFALVLGAVVFWVWRQRELAQRQAKTSEELALVGREVRGIAHDFGNLLTVVLAALESARRNPAVDLHDVLSDIGIAASSAKRLTDALHGVRNEAGGGSMEGIVRLAVALARGNGRVLLEVQGDFEFRGEDRDVLRLLLNLLGNATRECASSPDAFTMVRLRPDGVFVSNPIRPGTTLDDGIYEEGRSDRGSSGMGLAIVRQAADRLGWRVSHEVREGKVTFRVCPT